MKIGDEEDVFHEILIYEEKRLFDFKVVTTSYRQASSAISTLVLLLNLSTGRQLPLTGWVNTMSQPSQSIITNDMAHPASADWPRHWQTS